MDTSTTDIFANSFDKLKHYLRSRYSTLSEYDAEDIVQQTALRMLVKGGHSDVQYAASYVYTALRNSAKNYFRSRRREIVTDEVDPGSAESAEAEMMAEVLSDHFADALSMLDEKSRFVFVQTQLCGTSYAELAEQTGEPVGTLLSRKSRAVKKLKIILDQYENR